MHVHALPLMLAALAAPVAAGSAAAAAASSAAAPAPAATQIDKVHIVWMNHLDVGFTNNIASVMNEYFHVSDTLRAHAWLAAHPLCLESNARPEMLPLVYSQEGALLLLCRCISPGRSRPPPL